MVLNTTPKQYLRHVFKEKFLTTKINTNLVHSMLAVGEGGENRTQILEILLSALNMSKSTLNQIRYSILDKEDVVLNLVESSRETTNSIKTLTSVTKS